MGGVFLSLVDIVKGKVVSAAEPLLGNIPAEHRESLSAGFTSAQVAALQVKATLVVNSAPIVSLVTAKADELTAFVAGRLEEPTPNSKGVVPKNTADFFVFAAIFISCVTCGGGATWNSRAAADCED